MRFSICTILPLLVCISAGAEESSLPEAIYGLRLGQSRVETLTALAPVEDRIVDTNDKRDFGRVDDQDWSEAADALVPELRAWVHARDYGLRERISIQLIRHRMPQRCLALGLALFTADRCDRIILAAPKGAEYPDPLPRIEKALGKPFPAFGPSGRDRNQKSTIEMTSWRATAWKRATTDGLERIVVEICTPKAREPLPAEEFAKREEVERERLRARPSDEAIIARLKTPPSATEPTPFSRTLLDAATYKERCEYQRKESHFDQRADAKDVGCKIALVAPGEKGWELGLRPGDAVLQIADHPISNGGDYDKFRRLDAQQTFTLKSQNGETKTITVPPGKIGILFGGNRRWLPVIFYQGAHRGAWDDDAIAACIAIDWNVDLAEQALAEALAKGWTGPVAQHLSGRIHCERGRIREGVAELMAAFNSTEDKDIWYRSWYMLAGRLAASGWCNDALAYADTENHSQESYEQALADYTAALREMTPESLQQDLSRGALHTLPSYSLKGIAEPVIGKKMHSVFAKALLDEGAVDLTAGDYAAWAAWDKVPDRFELSFTFTPNQKMLFSSASPILPDIRFGVSHLSDDVKIMSPRMWGEVWLHSDGSAEMGFRNFASMAKFPTSFRPDGKPHHLRMVRWDERIRFDIDDVCCGETVMCLRGIGGKPHLVPWFMELMPALFGQLSEFSLRGYGEAPMETKFADMDF